MGRPPLWTAIRDTLRNELAAGRYRAGDRLPTEGRLAGRFGVNRHTIRRALADLAGAGLVHPRRGAGVFVSDARTTYPLGRRVRFHQTLAEAGQTAEKRALSLETRHADPREAAALGLSSAAPVHVYEGISLADGMPLALFRSVFPAERFPWMLEALAETPSVTEALARQGVADFTRAATEVTAMSASATLAAHLRIATGAAILRTVSVNVDPDGTPIEAGRAWFAGDRVALTIGDG
jgi:GntR family phosphonate transport system transcriptional regulator